MRMRNLAKDLENMVTEAIESEVENFDFSAAIEAAVENTDLSDLAADAVRDAVENAEIDKLAEDAVETAASELDVEKIVEETVKCVLQDELPGMVQQAIYTLLQQPEFLEALTAALFERPVQENTL